MDNNNNPFSGFDWNSFEKAFGGAFTNIPKEQTDKSTWVEQYVREILKKSLPSEEQNGWEHHYNSEITETHQAIIIKIQIPDKTEARNIRIYTTYHQVKVESTAKDKFQLIRLPHPVIPKSCKAVYKDGILQLHIRKQDKDELFYEIDVRFS